MQKITAYKCLNVIASKPCKIYSQRCIRCFRSFLGHIKNWCRINYSEKNYSFLIINSEWKFLPLTINNVLNQVFLCKKKQNVHLIFFVIMQKQTNTTFRASIKSTLICFCFIKDEKRSTGKFFWFSCLSLVLLINHEINRFGNFYWYP